MSGVEAHVETCAELFGKLELRKCIGIISTELQCLLSRLWWISNLSSPVSQFAFPIGNKEG